VSKADQPRYRNDAASAVARGYTDYGRWGTCRNDHGYGTWAVCNQAFKEGHTIYYRAAPYDGDTGKYVGSESALDSSRTRAGTVRDDRCASALRWMQR
jgi:hypothetical protein